MGTLFGREPALIISLLGAALNLAISFGLHLTGDQIAAVSAFELALIGVIIRSQVTPNASVPMSVNPTKIGAILLVGMLALGNVACGDAFMHAAAVADRTLSENALTARRAADAAHAEDCDLQTPGIQPCLKDADYAKSREVFRQLGTAGLAFGAALRAGDKQGAYAQAQAAIVLTRDLLTNHVVKLPADDQVVAQSALSAIETALAALHP
jgi:hypothetical protein